MRRFIEKNRVMLVCIMILLFVAVLIHKTSAHTHKVMQEEMFASFDDSYLTIGMSGVSDAFEYAKPLLDGGRASDYAGKLAMINSLVENRSLDCSDAESEYGKFIRALSEAIYSSYSISANTDSAVIERTFPDQGQREAFRKYLRSTRILRELVMTKRRLLGSENQTEFPKAFIALGKIQLSFKMLRDGDFEI